MQVSSKQLLKPKSITISPLDADDNNCKIVMEPFERGFGHTLGNSLRRILLSSMVGTAVTEVKIAGITHEYDVINGVMEDVVDILLNIKGLIFKLHNKESTIVKLNISKSGVVRGSEIELTHDVELLNPDHEICTISKNGTIEMEIKIETGRGYETAATRRQNSETSALGWLVLDSTFSPVLRVAFNVENARVEQKN